MKIFKSLLAFGLAIISTTSWAEFTQGIYLTQSSLEDTKKFTNFITKAGESGINTFVIDLDRPSERYQENLALLGPANIRYVARVVMFPDGGVAAQIKNPNYWQKRWRLVETAISYGASAIQLDYIRYKAKTRASKENVKDIHEIVTWYKDKMAATKTPLQLDVFGVATLGPSLSIGQDLQVLGPTVDTLCPMLYPSHWEPFVEHAKTPYETLDRALKSLYAMFPERPSFKVVPYIELFNYRYPLGPNQRREYIKAQIKAITDNKADGWFAWSAGNKYDRFFSLLTEMRAENGTSHAQLTPPY